MYRPIIPWKTIWNKKTPAYLFERKAESHDILGILAHPRLEHTCTLCTTSIPSAYIVWHNSHKHVVGYEERGGFESFPPLPSSQEIIWFFPLLSQPFCLTSRGEEEEEVGFSPEKKGERERKDLKSEVSWEREKGERGPFLALRFTKVQKVAWFMGVTHKTRIVCRKQCTTFLHKRRYMFDEFSQISYISIDPSRSISGPSFHLRL